MLVCAGHAGVGRALRLCPLCQGLSLNDARLSVNIKRVADSQLIPGLSLPRLFGKNMQAGFRAPLKGFVSETTVVWISDPPPLTSAGGLLLAGHLQRGLHLGRI